MFLLPERPITSFDDYLATDTGGLGIERTQRLGPTATIDEVLASGLHGRGGGGFHAGRKRAGIASQDEARRYVVYDGVEGERGTFRPLPTTRSPHQPTELLEPQPTVTIFLTALPGTPCLHCT